MPGNIVRPRRGVKKNHAPAGGKRRMHRITPHQAPHPVKTCNFAAPPVPPGGCNLIKPAFYVKSALGPVPDLRQETPPGCRFNASPGSRTLLDYTPLTIQFSVRLGHCAKKAARPGRPPASSPGLAYGVFWRAATSCRRSRARGTAYCSVCRMRRAFAGGISRRRRPCHSVRWGSYTARRGTHLPGRPVIFSALFTRFYLLCTRINRKRWDHCVRPCVCLSTSNLPRRRRPQERTR